MSKTRVYVDASVFGGNFDGEFEEGTWNFKHLVNPVRIRGFNGVNAVKGYGPVVIMTPEDLAKVWKEEQDGSDD